MSVIAERAMKKRIVPKWFDMESHPFLVTDLMEYEETLQPLERPMPKSQRPALDLRGRKPVKPSISEIEQDEPEVGESEEAQE